MLRLFFIFFNIKLPHQSERDNCRPKTRNDIFGRNEDSFVPDRFQCFWVSRINSNQRMNGQAADRTELARDGAGYRLGHHPYPLRGSHG